MRKKSKQKFSLVLLVITFSYSFMHEASASTCKEIIAAANINYPPISWYDGKSFRGVSIQIAKLIADDLDIPIHFKYVGPWKRTQIALETGKIDLITALYYNRNRAKKYQYTSSAFMDDPVVVVVPIDSPMEIKNKSDLETFKGVTLYGESFGTAFDSFIVNTLEMNFTHNYKSMFKMLKSKRAHYILHGLYPVMANAYIHGFSDQIRVLYPPMITTPHKMAFSKNSSCVHLTEVFSRKIDDLVSAGVIEKLLEQKWREWKIFQN